MQGPARAEGTPVPAEAGVRPWPPGRALSLAAALAGAGLLLLGALLLGPGLVLLAGSVLAGVGLTHLSGLPLLLEERIAFGAVIGPLVTTLAAFLVALAFGFGLASVLAGLLVALALSGPGWALGSGRLRPEAAAAASRLRSQWPLWALLAACWAYTLHFLAAAYAYGPNGLTAGAPGIYGDWATHLTYAGSFAYGRNLPPEFPIDPGHRLGYPFMVDYFAACLVPLGTSLTSALVETSGLLGLAFPAVMYLAGRRLTGSRGAAALGVLVFTMGGGLGFVYLAGDLDRYGPGVLGHLPRLYTQDVALNYQWLNPVLGWMIPQRSTLFGFSLALIVAALLWLAARQPRRRAWAYAFAGVVAGLTPLFHLHAYGTLLALPATWALASRRREWLAYFAPALALGGPVVLWLVQPGSAELRPLPGWYADLGGHHDGAVWFWLKNTGLLIPLMVVGQLWRGLFSTGFALLAAPIWLWFLVPNLYVFQPWEWDNTKFFAFWALFGSLLVGAVLARLARAGGAGVVLAGGLLLVLVLAGGLDLARNADYQVSAAAFADQGGLQTARWVRENTDPRSVFLVAPEHNEPIPTLAGRREVVGYGGWLWTYGLSDWIRRTDDARLMLRGDPRTPALLREYGVSYVVLGPQELGPSYGASPIYWNATADRVYVSGSYSVYRVRR